MANQTYPQDGLIWGLKLCKSDYSQSRVGGILKKCSYQKVHFLGLPMGPETSQKNLSQIGPLTFSQGRFEIFENR